MQQTAALLLARCARLVESALQLMLGVQRHKERLLGDSTLVARGAVAWLLTGGTISEVERSPSCLISEFAI